MADLPSDRLQIEQSPFSHVGIDYFVHINVRQARSIVKRNECVLTCLTVRAIHIEIVYSMSPDSFLCVLRKFIARPGKSQRILSDNGANFVGAAQVLRDTSKVEELNKQRIHNFFCKQISHGVSVLPQQHGWSLGKNDAVYSTYIWSLVKRPNLN